jgi:hypothetical protein
MRCVITVRISNNGPVTVHLDGATADYLGPGTGAVVTAANEDGASPDGGLDARYKLRRTLGRGQTYRFDVVVRFHPSGCNDSGRLWVTHWPKVQLTVLGLAHEQSADDTFSFHRSGPTPGCRNLESSRFD